MKGAGATAGDTGDSRVAMNVRVRVYPGTDGEIRGTVLEDFGDMAGQATSSLKDGANPWAMKSADNNRSISPESTASNASNRRLTTSLSSLLPTFDLLRTPIAITV